MGLSAAYTSSNRREQYEAMEIGVQATVGSAHLLGFANPLSYRSVLAPN